MTTPPGFSISDGPTISSWPRVLLQIAWGAGGNSTLPNHWYTVSNRLRDNWKATLAGRQYELDAVQAGTMNFTLDNLDGAFDPDNTSSFFYPNVVPYRRCRMVLVNSPTKNLMQPWIAMGTSLSDTQYSSNNATIYINGYPPSVAASTGTLGTATGLTAAPSGRTTALTWAIPNSTSSGAVFGPTGATQSWTTTDSNGITVTPGASYSIGADLTLAAGGMTSLSMLARIRFYDLNGTLLMSASNSATVTNSAWTRITASATAPSNAAFAIPVIVTNATTTSATTVQTTGWQVEQAAAATSWANPGTWGQIWQGYIERWPQRYNEGKYGMVDVTAVDALAPLSQVTMGYVMPQWVASTSPQYSFDLAATSASAFTPGTKAFLDLGGSGAALELIGNNLNPGQSITSTNGVGTLWNTPGPVFTLTNSQTASLGNASGAGYLRPAVVGSNVILPTSGGWTRMINFRTTATPGTGGTYTLATLWNTSASGAAAGSGDQSVAYAYINSNGFVGANIQNSAGTSLAAANSLVNVCDGDWHCALISLSADGKKLTITVDDYVWINTGSTNVHSTTYDHDSIGTWIDDGSVNTQPFNGDMAWFAQWNSELATTDTIALATGFANGWGGGFSTADQMLRTMKLSGFHSGNVVNARFVGSQAIAGGLSFQGRAALDIIQEYADTETGQFAVARDGMPTLFGQLWRWLQSQPVAIFGENVSGGEIPYLGDIAFEQDPAHLYNDVQITCDGSLDLTDVNGLQEAQDATSQAAYFPQSLQRTITPSVVQGGLNIAGYLLSQFKDPHTRLNGLTVDLASNASLLAKVLYLNFADRVRVNRRPTLAPSKSLDCYIEQIEWSGDDTGENLQLHMQMSPASQYQYGVISAAWAPLTANASAGVTTITVSPIQGNNAIAAQAVIPPNYTMTLGYGTANQETVTVASVQTVSAGYSTVVLTLSAATTKAHSIGDLICDVNPGTVALPPVGTYPSCLDAVSLTGGTTPLIGF